MTRLEPRRAPRGRSTDFDGSGVGECWLAGSILRAWLSARDAADAAPIRNLGTPARRRLFERARSRAFLEQRRACGARAAGEYSNGPKI